MWRAEYDPTSRILSLRIRGRVERGELLELAAAQARALEATAGAPFQVLLDLTGLFPLDEEGVALLGAMKRIAAETRGFTRLAVLVDSPTVALQQSRVRVSGTGSGRELVSQSEGEVRRFLGAMG